MNEGITLSFETIVSVLGVGFMSLAGVVYRGITGRIKDGEDALKNHINETKEELRETNRELQKMNVSLAKLVGRIEEERGYPTS